MILWARLRRTSAPDVGAKAQLPTAAMLENPGQTTLLQEVMPARFRERQHWPSHRQSKCTPSNSRSTPAETALENRRLAQRSGHGKLKPAMQGPAFAILNGCAAECGRDQCFQRTRSFLQRARNDCEGRGTGERPRVQARSGSTTEPDSPKP